MLARQLKGEVKNIQRKLVSQLRLYAGGNMSAELFYHDEHFTPAGQAARPKFGANAEVTWNDEERVI
jgi:hypothetical protein